MIKLKPLYESSGRQLGKKLTNVLNKTIYVNVYRATTNLKFHDMDYVTLSLKFAVEHAENNTIVNGEPYHVIHKLMTSNDIYEAYNHGTELKGRIIYNSKGDDYEGWDELTDKDFIRFRKQ